jgi:hypothetical protein
LLYLRVKTYKSLSFSIFGVILVFSWISTNALIALKIFEINLTIKSYFKCIWNLIESLIQINKMSATYFSDPAFARAFDPLHVPCQPKNLPFPPNHKPGAHKFSENYYSMFPWVEYSLSTHSAYCYYCRHFCSRKAEPAFKSNGFKGWKNAKKLLLEHHLSEDHKFAHQKFISAKVTHADSAKSVLSQIDLQHLKNVATNRSNLRSILRSIKFCAYQGTILNYEYILVLYERINNLF